HTPDQAATSFIHLENATIIRGSRGAVKRPLRGKSIPGFPASHDATTEATELHGERVLPTADKDVDRHSFTAR
ncbi:MAG: hypothetical protein LBW77_07195, partial [Verrucomicrobiota bacterium]|nr:hypothetical protein [Verrucomicrobiota bacterium]